MASSSFCTLFSIFYLWLQLSLYDRCGRRPVLRCSSQCLVEAARFLVLAFFGFLRLSLMSSLCLCGFPVLLCRPIGPRGLQGGWCDLVRSISWRREVGGSCSTPVLVPMLAKAGASRLELLLLSALELGCPLRLLRCLNGPRGLRG